MLRSLLTLLIAMTVAMAGVLLSFSGVAPRHGSGAARLDTAPAPATTRVAKQPPRAEQRSLAATKSVTKSTGVRARARMYAERARGQIYKAHREISAHPIWAAASGGDASNDDRDQLVPGSGFSLLFDDDGGAVGDVLASGLVETHRPLGAVSGSERSVPSRPRTMSRTVDVPPPRRA